MVHGLWFMHLMVHCIWFMVHGLWFMHRHPETVHDTDMATTHAPTSPHDPTNRLISEDRNNHPPVQISRNDGQTPLFRGLFQSKYQLQIGRFGLVVRVGGRLTFSREVCRGHSKLHPTAQTVALKPAS